jgi:hypothetical protein
MNRIYHTFDKWECYPAGFYETKAPAGMTDPDCILKYKELLSDIDLFKECLNSVITEWVNSCEHYLTNEKMNRIAWLGQASLAYKYGIPSKFRGGYNELTDEQKMNADLAALEAMNTWMQANGYETMTLEEAQSKTEANLY